MYKYFFENFYENNNISYYKFETRIFKEVFRILENL